jgi:hypothetical protein
MSKYNIAQRLKQKKKEKQRGRKVNDSLEDSLVDNSSIIEGHNYNDSWLREEDKR